MSHKYDKKIELSHEEEGTYHRRETEYLPASPQTTTKNYTTKSYQVVPAKSHHTSSSQLGQSSCDEDNFDEWTTSKRKVNHKTRQVETRVCRQLLVEDGKVIADSGPQVTTRIKEDSKVDECEKEKAPKNKGKFDAIENAPECGDSSLGGRVLGEKKQIQRVCREVREENMQYHDERFKELTGHDVHRRAIQAPHELITINDSKHSANSAPRGKMVHYSNKGKKYQDTDEILEVAKLAIDGSITKEVKRTKHHEEFSDDEKPDETGEAEQLRKAPIASRSSRRNVDYVNDFDDISVGSDHEDHEPRQSSSTAPRKQQHYYSGDTSGKHRSSSRHRSRNEQEAFPRYEIDPLLNTLRDEDFKPTYGVDRSPSGRYKEHRPVKKDRTTSSSDSESDAGARHTSRSKQHQHHYHQQQRSLSPYARQTAVEIPEEYRVNKQRLLSSKGKTHERERSFSPTSKSHLSQASHRSNKSHKSHKEDASVQAHLTDEEIEKKSLKSSSSSGVNSHEKTTRQLQRQSTANSQRNYYFGESRPSHKSRQRSPSSRSSSSSSSLSDPKEKLRRQGARSKDSGFRSPHSHRTATPISTGSQQQIYSLSSKSKGAKNRGEDRRFGATSPTPTTGSVGQRSVKTTTTTMSAGLADRPVRSERSTSGARSPVAPVREKKQQHRGVERSSSGKGGSGKVDSERCTRLKSGKQEASTLHKNASCQYPEYATTRQTFDNVSLSSLPGPNATTIKVPYKPQVFEHEVLPSLQYYESSSLGASSLLSMDVDDQATTMQENKIETLQRRLDNINKSQTLKVNRAQNSTKENRSDGREYFDYKTVIANVLPSPKQQTIDTYNVRVVEYNSPFSQDEQPVRSVNELSNSIARLELTSSEPDSGTGSNVVENNNETNFNLANFFKKPGQISLANEPKEDDNISLASSCSLRSSRTYNIRTADTEQASDVAADDVCHAEVARVVADEEEDDLNDESHFPVEVVNNNEGDENKDNESEGDDEKRPAAWVFDLRDGSSTAIKAPARPKKPESPKINSKTEELAESRGGRSYYLELIEQETNDKPTRARPSSIDSLYSRWNSHSTLNSKYANQSSIPQRRSTPTPSTPLATSETRKSRQIKPPSLLDSSSRSTVSGSTSNLQKQEQQQQQLQRRQLPFGGPSLSNRSKSSSCLLAPTIKQSKYSIYGGFKRPNNDNKPVPRLSYSRAIGPKSQRQIDAQAKTPSRYLKMK